MELFWFFFKTLLPFVLDENTKKIPNKNFALYYVFFWSKVVEESWVRSCKNSIILCYAASFDFFIKFWFKLQKLMEMHLIPNKKK